MFGIYIIIHYHYSNLIKSLNYQHTRLQNSASCSDIGCPNVDFLKILFLPMSDGGMERQERVIH